MGSGYKIVYVYLFTYNIYFIYNFKNLMKHGIDTYVWYRKYVSRLIGLSNEKIWYTNYKLLALGQYIYSILDLSKGNIGYQPDEQLA